MDTEDNPFNLNLIFVLLIYEVISMIPIEYVIIRNKFQLFKHSTSHIVLSKDIKQTFAADFLAQKI